MWFSEIEEVHIQYTTSGIPETNGIMAGDRAWG
jgi:hypothetical protein